MSEAPTTYDPFDADATGNTGYLYTTHARLSSRMANRRLTRLTLGMANWRGRRVIDIGCGDGAYTIEIFDKAHPASMCGVDPAAAAIDIARRRAGQRPIEFTADSAYALPYPDDSFDIAHLRGVLHHVEDPVAALREALRVAPVIVVIDPNGYNPGVKLLEKCSPYHVEHQEKSYSPAAFDRWIEELGATMQVRTWAGLVPFFCPDVVACSLKFVEGMVENTPLLRRVGCAVYAFTATRNSVARD